MVEEQRYLISEAAKLTEVEAHVLRYWEEELEIPIGRTKLGHRYYTGEDIRLFWNVKRLKEEGLQLKAIKVIIQRMRKEQISGSIPADRLEKDCEKESGQPRQDEKYGRTEPEPGMKAADVSGRETAEAKQETSLANMRQNAEKLRQFQELVGSIVEKVVKENNEELRIQIEEMISRETDYLLRMQEQREEERYRRLDEAIRAHQKNSRYVAAAKEKRGFLGWFRK